MDTYKVNVIIPTYKPDEKFDRLIEKLRQQTYPIQQIMIMNTKTGTFPEEKCSPLSNLKVFDLDKSNFDHGGTRHKAAELCDGDFLLFMTQDAVPADEYLIERLIEPFKNDKVAAAYARQLPAADCKIIEKYTRSFNYPEQSQIKRREDLDSIGIKTFFCSNVCAIYRRDIYMKLGGFERKTIFNEDMIFAGKLVQNGWHIAYAAGAQVIHSHNYGSITQFKRNFDLAVSQKQHPEVFAGIRSESEGMKLVKRTAMHLIRIKKPWLIVQLIVQSGFKYLGYFCGMRYDKLPGWAVNRFTMNKAFWK